MGIGDSVIRPLKNALDGMPIHVRQLGEMIRQHRAQQRRNQGGVNDIDHFDGGPDAPTRPRTRRPDDDALVPRPECLDENGDIDWSKAPENGFVLDADGNPIMQDHVPNAGDRFDRYGDPGGRYVSPVPEDGPFSYDSRSLPYHENPNSYHEYEWRHSPADVESVYNQLDDATRTAVDDTLAKYDLDLSDLTSVSRGEAAPIPDWGTAGGATQDLLPVSVDLLDKMGMIGEVGR
ncbi:TNT domain-containing protein [Microbacterium aerolatum]|uniref:TNT domain-containing protein n=1 Tax=Microbacterium aerolatum TaxID=153731 RepID=A0A511AFR3_9MICO|nr:glycohydrolase toxin TNT-related protein [Microbacterium aerolatum]MCK3768733.1 TNT domain-containing protein [Microbacterium aerolatum]GEK85511.1 hypothetical protein MAE01_06870 [Microbacterium aerolatum]GGB31642.1 hypothetical protein GCM10007198_22680 [Microbacterium aerolatum]